MTAALVVFCGVLGLLIGSFLNVVIWRVPRGESIVHPGSHCPSCDAAIAPYDNLPVLSWLVLRGRCRHCAARISVRYPLVESATAAIFAALAGVLGFDAALPAFLYLGAIGVALAPIDLDVHRLPDAITLPSYAVGALGLAAAAVGSGELWPLARALIGMAALYGFYLILALVYPAGMGWGDVKLAGVLGLYLGYLSWGVLLVGAMAGFVIGGVVGGVLIVAGRAGRKTKVPFGPSMIAGTLVAVVVGQPIADAYLRIALG